MRAAEHATGTDRPKPYSGYFHREVPTADPELTNTGPGTPMGEYMRRFWQPVCLSTELAELPKSIRILSEDLVAYRDRAGTVGVLHRHCSHRGTSLEYGIIAERGLRCCYHGWLFNADGSILDTPGEPSTSRLKEAFRHGAYPAREHEGLVFIYMGPPQEQPVFVTYDTSDVPGNELIPFSIAHPCNWLQIHENHKDPIHSVFLYVQMGNNQLPRVWGELPVLDFRETDGGAAMVYISNRRKDDETIWVRNQQSHLPNFVKIAGIFDLGCEERYFMRAGMEWWTVPNDDTHSTVFGWRHFNEEVDPHHEGQPELIGVESCDHVAGRTHTNPYETQQRTPGDWEVLVSQRPVAIHALEHLGTTDTGVVMFQKLLRAAVREENPEAWPARRFNSNKPLATHVQDTVLKIPVRQGTVDREVLRNFGAAVTDAVIQSAHLSASDRRVRIENCVFRERETLAGQ